MRKIIKITDPKEDELLAELEKRTDFKSLRIKRLLALPDLTKKPNSPVKILVDGQFFRAGDARLGGEIGHGLEGSDVIGAAVRVTRIIDGVDPDENVGGTAHLSEG